MDNEIHSHQQIVSIDQSMVSTATPLENVQTMNMKTHRRQRLSRKRRRPIDTNETFFSESGLLCLSSNSLEYSNNKSLSMEDNPITIDSMNTTHSHPSCHKKQRRKIEKNKLFESDLFVNSIEHNQGTCHQDSTQNEKITPATFVQSIQHCIQKRSIELMEFLVINIPSNTYQQYYIKFLSQWLKQCVTHINLLKQAVIDEKYIHSILHTISSEYPQKTQHQNILNQFQDNSSSITQQTFISRFMKISQLACKEITNILNSENSAIKVQELNSLSLIQLAKNLFIYFVSEPLWNQSFKDYMQQTIQHELFEIFIHTLLPKENHSQTDSICSLKQKLCSTLNDNERIDCQPIPNKISLPLGLIAGPEYQSGCRVFTHGNYNTYYKKQQQSDNNQTLSSSGIVLDPRLRKITELCGPDVFHNKKILDIGCNTGQISISLSGLLKAKYVIGIDIDAELISHCIQHIRQLKYDFFFKFLPITSRNKTTVSSIIPGHKTIVPETLITNLNFLPLPHTFNELSNELKQLLLQDDVLLSPNINQSPPFPFNIQCRAENFIRSTDDNILNQPKDTQHINSTEQNARLFDTILALSVTKWIHLHSGDDGLMKCFNKIYRLLKPGGFFILEPQSWDSYKKKRRVHKQYDSIVSRIQFRPHNFDQFLTSEIGFELIHTLQIHQSMTENADLSIRQLRTIFIYKKKL